MNRKDGGKEGRTREDEGGHPQLEPGRTSGNGGREEAGKAGSKEERGQGGGDFRSFWG